MEGAEGAADQGFRGGRGIGVEHVAEGFAGIDLFVAEGEEGQFGVGGGGGDLACGGVLPGVGDADFVLQFEDDAFGGFFSEAADAGEFGDIAVDHAGLEAGDWHAAEDGEGDGGADAADAVDQHEEEVAFFLGGEAVERVGAFADVEVGAEVDVDAFRGVEVVEGGEGDHDFVAHAVDIDDESVGVGFDDGAADSCDHVGGASLAGGWSASMPIGKP